jgi:hypothetical protein
MKKLILLSLLIFAAVQMKAQLLDTTISYYNFNGLNNGNLSNQDNWHTTLSGTSIDVQVAGAYSHDGTNALHFTQNGGGVNASGNRPLDTIFPNFAYGDSAVYYLYFDLKIEWWGSQFGLAYDQNNDGLVNMNQNNEKGFRFVPAANSSLGTKLYNAAGTGFSSITTIGGGWQRIEIKLEPFANNGHGYISVRSRSVSATTWTTLFSNINLGLDTTTATAKNPTLWDQVFFHFTGSGSG